MSLKPIYNLFFKLPLVGIYEFTLTCNQTCNYCDLPLNQGRYEMSYDEIVTTFTRLYKEGLRFLFIQGGEPMVRSDVIEILEVLSKIGYTLSLVTNGTRFTKEKLERLEKIKRLGISVSLDTLDTKKYESIRGKDHFHQVMKGIDLLKDCTIPKYITCVVSGTNRHEVMDIVDFANKVGFLPVVAAYHHGDSLFGKTNDELMIENKDAIDIFEEILRSDKIPFGQERAYIKDNINWLSGKGLPACDAGRYSIAIDASGEVSACLPFEKVGNVRTHTLKELVANIDHKKVKECSDKSTCNLACSRVVSTGMSRPLQSIVSSYRFVC